MENRAVFCEMDNNWPLHIAHPLIAKLPPNILISPIYWSDTFSFSFQCLLRVLGLAGPGITRPVEPVIPGKMFKSAESHARERNHHPGSGSGTRGRSNCERRVRGDGAACRRCAGRGCGAV